MVSRILCGDVVECLGKYGDDVFDGCLCDPPYGLNFMGRNWDGVVPDMDVWAEVLRVLKPGAFLLAFGGTRTWHRLACAIEDAVFELRDTCMWLYGCLSDDTEILTEDGWKTYDTLSCGSMVMCYNVSDDQLEWGKVQEVFTYAYSDTAYSIRSDSTDQIVTRNHRCLVERGGGYIYETAERLASQEKVPVLDDLSDLWGGVLENPGMVQTGEGCIVRERMSSHMEITRQGTPQTHAENSKHGPGWMDGQKQGVIPSENERTQQPGMEGWSDVFQDQGELQRCQVREMPRGISGYGAEGQLRDGASVDRSATLRTLPQEVRGCPSHRPRSNQQRSCKSDAVIKQHGAQAIRGAWRTHSTLATITPIHYNGIVWCVRVPTGAFVARRNGHVFVTGNSGFPKSHAIGKAIDKAAGAEREVVGYYPIGRADGFQQIAGQNTRPWQDRVRAEGHG